MEQIKSALIKLALEYQVLQFGRYTLKSGRISPYFFNAGLFYQGSALRQLGQLYASILLQTGLKYDHLFGPAYKGIPLATATAIALAEQGKDISVTFNRKEIKQHGEGGQLLGSPLWGNTVIIDDVITAGTAFREAQKLINSQGGTITAVIIALDRCESGSTEKSTLTEIKEQGVEVYSIINVYDIMDYLMKTKQLEQVKDMEKYLAEYACSDA